jgi:hypothetical protein
MFMEVLVMERFSRCRKCGRHIKSDWTQLPSDAPDEVKRVFDQVLDRILDEFGQSRENYNPDSPHLEVKHESWSDEWVLQAPYRKPSFVYDEWEDQWYFQGKGGYREPMGRLEVTTQLKNIYRGYF